MKPEWGCQQTVEIYFGIASRFNGRWRNKILCNAKDIVLFAIGHFE
jgi:hypothetical protein